MNFFGKKNAQTSSASLEQALPVAKDLGVIIHVMPKDFLGVVAELHAEPVPIPVVAQPVAPLPVSQSQLIRTPKRRVPVWAVIVIAVLVVCAIGSAIYVILVKSQIQTPVADLTPTVALPVIPSVEKPVIEVPVEPEPSKDSDSDGLTDIEERMYGTDYRNPDSDGDTFLDGNEVFHRYDPIGIAPSTLLDTGAVKVFNDSTLPFTLYYPVSWKASVDAAKSMVTFKTPNVASIVVTWSLKDVDLTVEDWILKNIKDVDLATLQASYTKEGYYTLRSEDDLAAYVDLGETVYVMTYALSTSMEISYTQTFAMMVNSLTVMP
ncbi:MAG: hypothetical protein WC776_00685 [Patescibacteria group bacterium]|jgi:hypothetical protein